MNTENPKVRLLPKLTVEELKVLSTINKSIMDKVEVIDEDEHHIPCHYKISKSLKWPINQLREVNNIMFKYGFNKSVSTWMLNLPKTNGFLGETALWSESGLKSPVVISYCLSEKCSLEIDGTIFKLVKGEGISFPMSTIHSLPKQNYEQKWICSLHMFNEEYLEMLK